MTVKLPCWYVLLPPVLVGWVLNDIFHLIFQWWAR